MKSRVRRAEVYFATNAPRRSARPRSNVFVHLLAASGNLNSPDDPQHAPELIRPHLSKLCLRSAEQSNCKVAFERPRPLTEQVADKPHDWMRIRCVLSLLWRRRLLGLMSLDSEDGAKRAAATGRFG
jgi:hypothetical protein